MSEYLLMQAIAGNYCYSEAVQRDYGNSMARSFDQHARFCSDLIN